MIAIKVPPLGESIVEATVARWLKQEGDPVAQGDTLVELETDKITVEVPALKAGTMSRQLKKEGDVVGVDEVLGELDETAVSAASAPATRSAPRAPALAAQGAAQGAAQSRSAEAAPSAPRAERDAASQKTSPAVRRLASEESVDLSRVPGTGRGGRVTKTDVVNFVGSREAGGGSRSAETVSDAPRPRRAARPPAEDGARETREKMSTRRRRIAEHLLEAQHATAHLTTFNEVDMSAVLQLRGRLKERVEKEHGVKLTFMPFFMKAAAMALQSYPVVNAQVDGDSILYKHYVDMGIAVASDQGLVVPVIRGVDRVGLIEMSRRLSDVASRARDGKLSMEDITGGTFTITNGGVFGSLVSTPILNYPQVGILGLHAIQERPVAVGGKVEIRPMMYIALSYDHRIVDGQQAVLFLVRVKELMEDPAAMLVE